MSHKFSDRVFAIVDAMKIEAFAELFADSGRFVFANAEPLIGRPAIVAGLSGFFSSIQGIRHELVNEWSVDADTTVESLVTYRRPDDKTVTVPAVSIWRPGDDGLITDYRIYVDLAPLYVP